MWYVVYICEKKMLWKLIREARQVFWNTHLPYKLEGAILQNFDILLIISLKMSNK